MTQQPRRIRPMPYISNRCGPIQSHPNGPPNLIPSSVPFVMSNAVKIIECPRDAWQGLPVLIPAEIKADYLRALVSAGFRHLDAVSFVSEKAVPQMVDSEQVLALADLPSLAPPDDLEIIGI